MTTWAESFGERSDAVLHMVMFGAEDPTAAVDVSFAEQLSNDAQAIVTTEVEAAVGALNAGTPVRQVLLEMGTKMSQRLGYLIGSTLVPREMSHVFFEAGLLAEATAQGDSDTEVLRRVVANAPGIENED